jgi:hypothetical protein
MLRWKNLAKNKYEKNEKKVMSMNIEVPFIGICSSQCLQNSTCPMLVKKLPASGSSRGEG